MGRAETNELSKLTVIVHPVLASAWSFSLLAPFHAARLHHAHIYLERLAIFDTSIKQFELAVAIERDLVAVAVDIRQRERVGCKTIQVGDSRSESVPRWACVEEMRRVGASCLESLNSVVVVVVDMFGAMN